MGKLALVVEDDRLIVYLLSAALVQEKYGVVSAATVEMAKEKADTIVDWVDLVITDVDVAGSNGLDLIAHYRSRWRDVKVIAISGNSDRDRVESEAISKGADMFIPKPFKVTDLRRIVVELVGE